MIRIIHLGLGKIGQGVIEAILAQPKHLQLVGVIDPHPALAGTSLRALMGKHAPNLKISPSLKTLNKKADVATMTTGSRTIDVRSACEELIKAKLHIVSTCEELAYPLLHAPTITKLLDKLAAKHGVAILGTGVNPGFAMDAFALACTAPCASVSSLRIVRSLDARKRRLQLQKKIGAGMTLKEVNALIKKNAIGHVGLTESAAMLAAGFGWKIQTLEEKFTAIVAQEKIASDYITIAPGQVRGLSMIATATIDGKKKLVLDLTMAFGADTFDEVQITGIPNLTIRTTTGFPGELSTCGIVANCCRAITTLKPGIRTMLDVFRARSVGS